MSGTRASLQPVFRRTGATYYTLGTTGGTSRDTNSILSGSGWHMSGSRIQVTATSQATARDGHREGACLLLGSPIGWRGDGSQGIMFVLDDILWPSASGSLMMFGVGLLDPQASQAAQNGCAYGMHDNTGPTIRLPQIGSVSQATSTSLGGTLVRQEIEIAPVYSGGSIIAGRTTSVGWYGASPGATLGANIEGTRTDVVGTTPQIFLVAGFTGTTAGTARTFGARIRYAVIDHTPVSEVVT